jgi:protein-tyrosine kinase
MSRNLGIVAEAAPEAPSRRRTMPPFSSNGAGEAVEHTAAGAEVARLVHRLFLSAATDEQPRIVTFSGVDRRAGCSWICAKAAELLATHTASMVCVVDANFLYPSLHDYFRTELSPGLADALRQAQQIEQFVARTPTNRLWMMPAGSGQGTGIVNPQRMRTRLCELREEFGFVLVDAPAMSLSSDALLLGSLSEGIVMVIASNTTRRDAARTAKQVLEDAKVPILGAVLNRRTYPIPAALYRRL